MLQPAVYLEARVLLAGTEGKRCSVFADGHVDEDAARKACLLVKALDGKILEQSFYEQNLASPMPPEADWPEGGLTRLSL
jgi:hypothetical protein